MPTTNHGYNQPSKGDLDWDVPVNSNFDDLDVDVEVRDTAANRSSYTPEAGAKFVATDTGDVHFGDGASWNFIGSVGQTRNLAATTLIWEDSGTHYAYDVNGQVASGSVGGAVIQSALDNLPQPAFASQKFADSNTGRILFRTPYFADINSTLMLPRYGCNIEMGPTSRGKGFRNTGNIVFNATPTLGPNPMLATYETLATDASYSGPDGDLTLFGATFEGIKFYGNNIATPLIYLPDADTVQFIDCNPRLSAGDGLQCIATSNLDIATVGLPGKIEIIKCEFAENARDNVRFVDNTQNLIEGSMFNPADRHQIYIQESNKIRIYGNEFNAPNRGNRGAGAGSTIRVVAGPRLTHLIVAVGNIFVLEPDANGIHEDEAGNVQNNVYVGNTMSGTSNQTIIADSTGTDYWANGPAADEARMLSNATIGGEVTLTGNGEGVVLTTPDGTTQYRVRVDNAGNLVTEEVI